MSYNSFLSVSFVSNLISILCLFQSILKERSTNQDLYDDLVAEASHLGDKPGVVQDLDAVQGRWTMVIQSTEDKAERLRQTMNVWGEYKDSSSKLQEVLSGVEDKISDPPSVHSVEVDMIQTDIERHKVQKKKKYLKR